MPEFGITTHLYKPKQGTKSLPVSCLEANAALLAMLMLAGRAFSILQLWFSGWFWTTVPVVLFPFWIYENWYRWDTFLWVKISSLMPVATIWATSCRLGAAQSLFGGNGVSVVDGNAIVAKGSFLVLSANIIEAAIKDVFFPSKGLHKPSTLRFLNGISALLVIVAEIPSLQFVEVATINDKSYVHWPLGAPWVIAYTIWNLVFVQHNYPYSLFRHLMVLAAPILLCVQPDGTWDSSPWAQHRGYTLAFYFLFRNTEYDKLRAWTDVERRQFGVVFEVFCFAAVLCALVWQNFSV